MVKLQCAKPYTKASLKSTQTKKKKKTELFDILSVKMRKLSRDIIFVHEGHQLESEGLRR